MYYINVMYIVLFLIISQTVVGIEYSFELLHCSHHLDQFFSLISDSLGGVCYFIIKAIFRTQYFLQINTNFSITG